MAYPAGFLSPRNFALAFHRIVRCVRRDYKQFYRHLLPSYQLALNANIEDLISDIRRRAYKPSRPTVVYEPKASGILRPITILTLTDLIVYQAIVNFVANRFYSEQMKYAFTKCFGNIYAGPNSQFFFRSWKPSYRKFIQAVAAAFRAGNVYVADFDLVALYELIDHHCLRTRLTEKVSSNELLDLLFKCLASWTPDSSGSHIHHGIPQGPDPSGFLAECLLLHFDEKTYPDVQYFRYVDDIRLMATDEVPIKRALLRLDLASKELGLVPQAQKIELRRVRSVEELQKSVPSDLVAADATGTENARTAREMLHLWRRSMTKQNGRWVIADITKFKFAIIRLNRRRELLKRLPDLMPRYPHLSWWFATYLKKYRRSQQATDILLEVFGKDPIYDAAASHYIDALDVCEPGTDKLRYHRAVAAARKRSEEKTVLLALAIAKFRGRRVDAARAVRLIESEPHPWVRTMLIHELFGEGDEAPFKIHAVLHLLEKEVNSSDGDCARFCAMLLLREGPLFGAALRGRVVAAGQTGA